MPGGDWCEDEVEGDPLGKKRGGMSQQFQRRRRYLKEGRDDFFFDSVGRRDRCLSHSDINTN